ncbi:MAG: acylphosphatase [Gemmatimonadota bacterium]|nr:acylphosphatase [Gemmatimonadota bacterium]
MSREAEATTRWLISGRVQGVGFRWFVLKLADAYGVTAGWAANLADGRVEVVARGPHATLERFGTELAKGPRFARVDHVEKSDVPHDMAVPNTFEAR